MPIAATPSAPIASPLVFARQLDGSGGATTIDADAVSKECSWVHVDYSVAGADRYLAMIGVPDEAINALTRPDTRPRMLKLKDGVILSLRAVNMNPGSDPEDMVSLRFWVEPNRVISVRQRKLFSVQDAKDALDAGVGPWTSTELVSDIVERIADRIADFVGRIEEAIDGYEAVDEGRPIATLRSEVAQTRRQIARVRRFLAPQRDALEALTRDAPVWMATDVHSFREQADRIIRDVEDLDLARERALVLQEEILNRVAQAQNARMYVLSIVAVVFLPITFITGLFGMNVGGLPGTDSAIAFWAVAISMATASVGTIIWLKRHRWF